MFIGYICTGQIISDTPSDGMENITDFELSNAVFDDFYGKHIEETDTTIDIIPPKQWILGTYFHAKFSGNTYCGNADFDVDNTKDILVKRRKKGEFKWFTLYDIPATGAEDYIFTVYDPYAPKGALEYALVPVINGVETDYSIGEIYYDFDGLMLIENDKTIWTVTDIELDEQKNTQVGVSNTLEGKYPYVFFNGENDYYTGSLSATFIKLLDVPGRCFADTSDELHAHYAEVMDFLNDRRAKILKYADGRVRMIEITTPPSDSSPDHFDKHTISFDYTEIGDPYSNEDMNNYGFLDVGEEWWVR